MKTQEARRCLPPVAAHSAFNFEDVLAIVNEASRVGRTRFSWTRGEVLDLLDSMTSEGRARAAALAAEDEAWYQRYCEEQAAKKNGTHPAEVAPVPDVVAVQLTDNAPRQATEEG